jgi:hypothetical protein
MKLRLRRPSPSMVVAIVALVMSVSGSAVAAIDFARNSGAVDGLSAVKATSSVGHASGRLVATNGSGTYKGQIPGKFLAQTVSSSTFGAYPSVADNATGASIPLNSSSYGTLSASCSDQNKITGNVDPTVTVTFAAGPALNLARSIGGGNPTVRVIQAGTTDSFTINGSNTFRVQLELNRTDVVYEGQVRQDGAGTANGHCLIAGTVQKQKP